MSNGRRTCPEPDAVREPRRTVQGFRIHSATADFGCASTFIACPEFACPEHAEGSKGSYFIVQNPLDFPPSQGYLNPNGLTRITHEVFTAETQSTLRKRLTTDFV